MRNSLMLWVHSFGFFYILFCSQDFQHKPWIQTVQTLNHSKIIYRIFTDKNLTVVFKKTKKKPKHWHFEFFHTKSLLNISLCTQNVTLLICSLSWNEGFSIFLVYCIDSVMFCVYETKWKLAEYWPIILVKRIRTNSLFFSAENYSTKYFFFLY